MNLFTSKRTLARLAAPLLVLGLAHAIAQTNEELIDPPPGQWPIHGLSTVNQRFSPLDQVNVENAGDLRLTWSRALGYEGLVESSPTFWDGILYINGTGAVLALDGATGELIWEYRPEIHENASTTMRAGVTLYDGKAFYNRNDGIVVALDAKTGEEVWSTTVTDIGLREGFTAGPMVADGKVIVGPAGADTGGAPGKIIALSAEEGEILWTFNITPEPGDPAYETWQPTPPSWEAGVGGASAWSSGLYDPETRLIVWGTGQPTPWDRLDDRRGGGESEVSEDLYSASYVAIDIDTGELEWYHQVVPGDEWDYDMQGIPMLVDLEIDGEERRVVLAPTVTGYLVRLDIETGEFLGAFGKHPEYTVHMGYEDDGTPIINDEARFTEPGEVKRVCPGIRWARYNNPAYSPETGLYYSPNNHQCSDMSVFPLPPDWQPGELAIDFENVRNEEHFFDRFGAVEAIDPVTGETVWEFGVDYEMRGGVVATAGGIVAASFPDRTFRVFDAETGDVLFEQIMTADSEANPITYEVDGKQYFATLVGSPGGRAGKPGLRTVPGEAAVFVFSLPEETE